MASESKWEPNVGQRAVFKDQHRHTYSAPVVLNDGQWVMVTSEGFAPITQFFDDDFAGRLEFVEYRDEPDERLHVDGQGFRALQEAVAKERLRNEAERESARREALNALNPVDTARARAAGEANNLLAQRWSRQRPDPVPPPVLSKENIGMIAEEARWRKRKIEKTEEP